MLLVVLKQLISYAFPMWFTEYDYTCTACTHSFWSYDGTQNHMACKECGGRITLAGGIVGRIKYNG